MAACPRLGALAFDRLSSWLSSPQSRLRDCEYFGRISDSTGDVVPEKTCGVTLVDLFVDDPFLSRYSCRIYNAVGRAVDKSRDDLPSRQDARVPQISDP